MTLASLFSRGLHEAHLFVLAEVEHHVNAPVTTMLGKQGKAKELKIDSNVGVAPKGVERERTPERFLMMTQLSDSQIIKYQGRELKVVCLICENQHYLRVSFIH